MKCSHVLYEYMKTFIGYWKRNGITKWWREKSNSKMFDWNLFGANLFPADDFLEMMNG